MKKALILIMIFVAITNSLSAYSDDDVYRDFEKIINETISILDHVIVETRNNPDPEKVIALLMNIETLEMQRIHPLIDDFNSKYTDYNLDFETQNFDDIFIQFTGSRYMALQQRMIEKMTEFENVLTPIMISIYGGR